MPTSPLIAEVGAQTCRFALVSGYEQGRPQMSHYAEYEVADYANVHQVLAHYLSGLDGPTPSLLGLAVAGPVNGDRFVVTGSGWSFSTIELQQAFGFDRIWTTNECAVAALSLTWLGQDDCVTLGLGGPPPRPLLPGRYALIRSDMGLGVSAIEVTDTGVQIIDSEGGHMAFAPTNPLEVEILKVLSAELGRVSYERIVSWPGLSNLHGAICKIRGCTSDRLSSLEIMLLGRTGQDEACVQTLDTFLGALGHFAGESALMIGANRGVFFGGRSVVELQDLLAASSMRHRFEEKGRLSSVVKSLETWAVISRTSVLAGMAKHIVLNDPAEHARPRTAPAAKTTWIDPAISTDVGSTLLEGASCGLLVLDDALNIVASNDRYWSDSAIPGALRARGQPFAPCCELMVQDGTWTQAAALEVLEHFRHGRVFSAERRVVGGRILRDDAWQAPTGWWVLTANDVTISRSRAAELELITADLRKAKAEADAASRAKTAFLATMSHEIRTPLNGVLGMTQVMGFDQLSPQQRARLDVIRESGESLLAILNDVLDLSKIEAGMLSLEEVEFDLDQLLLGAHATFTALANKKGVSFALYTEPPARGAYVGDPTRVRQIIYNLVSNALKFTAEGEVRVTADYAQGALNLVVKDTGIGIAPDRLDALFEKFVQADASTTRQFGGTGLGLAICRDLVRIMGGDIAVESILGEGTSFTIRLPLRRCAFSGEAGASPGRVQHSTPPPSLRVLAAEDNAVNQLVLKTLLHQVGIEVTLVNDGEQALARWEAQDWDLILMDVQMPRMDGPTAARLIRQREAAAGRARTPIIALTANVMSHQVSEYVGCGMDACVGKPLELTALFQAMTDVCGAQPNELVPAPAKTSVMSRPRKRSPPRSSSGS